MVVVNMNGDLSSRPGSGRAAFDALSPIAPGYATLPLPDGFNWSECAARIDAGVWYLVAFRSVRRAGADEPRLIELDTFAHEEAKRSPGFVHYFSGSMDARRACLSFCIWENQDLAEAGAHLAAHEEAASAADEMYDSYVLERFTLTKRPGSPELQLELLSSQRVR